MRKTWIAFGLLSLLALSVQAKVGPETRIYGPYLTPAPAQLNVAVGGSDVLLYAWTENGRIWAKSSIAANAVMLPNTGGENVVVGGVAYNEGRFLVAWLENGEPFAARVSREGALLDGLPIRLGAVANDIDVIADPQGFRVFLDQQQTGFGMSRITAAGQLVDLVPLPIGTGRPQTVVASGDRFAWLQSTQNRPNVSGPGLIQVRFNSRPAGNEPTPGVRTLGVAGLSALPFMEPALATNGSIYLMVYHNGHEIRGARLNADGTPIDPANGLLLAVDAMAPSASPKPLQAVWDGANFLVVWEDVRADGNHDIKGAYITTTAAPRWFDIAVGPAAERAPVLHVIDPGRVLVVYQKISGQTTEIVQRVITEKRERVVRR